MLLTEEDVEFEWATWGDNKPWFCTECEMLLAVDAYTECDGTDPEMPTESWHPHEPVQATEPLGYQQFSEVMLKRAGQEETKVQEES